MKWFHHDCTARHDPRLQILGATHGPEGLGIFWGLLEEIGQHSDTFHLKIMQISKKSDKSFANLLENPLKESNDLFDRNVDLSRIPRLPVKTLAKNLFTTSKTLTAIIATCISAGLFDRQKWLRYNVLYSPSFERRGDDYTRRLQRRSENVRTHSEQPSNILRSRSGDTSDNVRTLSGQHPESLRTKFRKVPLETEAEQIQKKRERTEKDLFVKDAKGKNEISTSCQQGFIELSEEQFHQYSSLFRSELSIWNESQPNKFDWNPTESELRKLFFGGEPEHKEKSCYSAYNLLGEKIHYAELVLRALRLMLRSSAKARITNPFGWMWSCLHGNGDGTLPWVQLLTADEENGVASSLRRRVRDNHPP
jgi:hypothetical protein